MPGRPAGRVDDGRPTRFRIPPCGITELYTHAVDQLGAKDAPVRLGGLYALERLAQNNPTQRQTIVNVICAYLRMPYTPPDDHPPGEDAPEEAYSRYEQRRQELQVRLTAQRILEAHLRPKEAAVFWADIDLDMTEAHLHQLNLSTCHIHQAQFDGAQFTGNTDLMERAWPRASITSFCRGGGPSAPPSPPKGRKKAGSTWCAMRIRATRHRVIRRCPKTIVSVTPRNDHEQSGQTRHITSARVAVMTGMCPRRWPERWCRHRAASAPGGVRHRTVRACRLLRRPMLQLVVGSGGWCVRRCRC